MNIGRMLALLPLTALVLGLSVGARRSRAERVGAPSAASEARTAACGVHGCGCPHEDVSAGCCCAPGADEAPAPRARRVAAPARSAGARLALAGDLPTTTLEAFHCSGGRQGRAAMSGSFVPAATITGISVLVHATRSDWVARLEPEPLYDLRTEPGTPPPRQAHESQLG